MELLSILLQERIGKLGYFMLGFRCLVGVLHAHGDDHLVLPQRDRVDDRGLDLLCHQCVGILNETDLRPGLDRDLAGQLQIMQLLLETVAQSAEVLRLLGILCIAGLCRLLLKLLQLIRSHLSEALLARCDIHGQFLEVLQIEIIHLVKGSDILQQLDLVAFEHLHDIIDRGFRLVILRLQSDQLVALLLEELEESLILFFHIEGLQFCHKAGDQLADLTHVLVLDIFQRQI